ncbi:MAG: methylisocitrate lyase [Deltaproteobacteria bacterium GWC2_42_51]|nr:MAG: methylisocitrate lyase [Deltaproteobacteria bacterium GWA2_42_85]OGP23899.1 MAG: methylisocitrate lyase [Deltaproteobacteria bacterium GWB2_42_7]OGP36212.1 MAG: methylisocitrate lyase [Deltaproteobacteria bacterium GWC2_42_51]OGP39037.1 MAG: methylisocitrate lyase [Deltaproteobacteria bacterium GWD2_42_10]OGP47828.1 MAG: methylisocitrate lyase [Deltaproteobacteria bacterium GWF2_42_12]OGQ28285.1 MAG: methylisocitrate lyase [Deltaproteobacteria bacterium RIFCSPHIGHO2_02_FULL_42_44]OGQ3
MTKTVSQPALFRKLLKKGIIVLPGAFNAASAMLIEKCGFKAVYMSGAGISNSAGLPDIGILARDEFVQQASYIASAVNIPVIADADTGFGGPSEVKETVRAFERAGVAGIQIEDQKPVTKKCGHLAGKEVISAKAMGEKIKAACRARRDKDFLIIARTDARGVNGFNDAVKRAKVYADAGADVIFPEALESKDEFKEFAKLVDESLMANMTEFGKTPYISIREFREMGYSIVLFPMTVFRIGMKAMEEALIELKRKETQKGLLRKMQTRKELYKLLGYEK